MKTQQDQGVLSVFDKIFVINLKSRRDRRDDMDRQLQRLGLSLEHPDVILFPAVRPENKGEFPTIGALGCFMSHVGVLRQATDMGLSGFLILEDDADFAPGFEAAEATVMSQLSSTSWGVVYGYGPADSICAPDPSGAPLTQISPETAVRTTHFLGLNGAVASQALPYLEAIAARPMNDPKGGAMHVDGAYSWFRAAHPRFATLVAVPAIAVQRPSRTDIHDLRWFDRIPALQPVITQLRRLKRALKGS